MPITFHPKPGMVLMCDFNTGFMPPEMVKSRRVVIISPYQFNKRGICTVVPLSTTTPGSVEIFHHRIPSGKYRFLSLEKDTWVKADMLATLSLARFDRIRVGHIFLAPSINEEDFQSVKNCVQNYLSCKITLIFTTKVSILLMSSGNGLAAPAFERGLCVWEATN